MVNYQVAIYKSESETCLGERVEVKEGVWKSQHDLVVRLCRGEIVPQVVLVPVLHADECVLCLPLGDSCCLDTCCYKQLPIVYNYQT